MKKKQKKCFKKLPFNNTYIEKPKTKGLKKIHLLQKLTFYDELNIYKNVKAFGWYVRSCKVEIVDSKDPLAQLEASKSSIKDLFR